MRQLIKIGDLLLFQTFLRLRASRTGREAPRIARRIVVYGGEEPQRRSQGEMLSWRDIDTFDWIEPEPGPGRP